jgi:hypothetical protein
LHSAQARLPVLLQAAHRLCTLVAPRVPVVRPLPLHSGQISMPEAHSALVQGMTPAPLQSSQATAPKPQHWEQGVPAAFRAADCSRGESSA